jgi:hypothetical protein
LAATAAGPLPDLDVKTHENQLSDLVFPPKSNAANERLARHLWAHRDDLFTFLRQPGLDATNWRAELAIRFGVILRKVWGGSRTWVGARAQAVRMSVGRTCWQEGRSALDFLSRLLRGMPVALALSPDPPRTNLRATHIDSKNPVRDRPLSRHYKWKHSPSGRSVP